MSGSIAQLLNIKHGEVKLVRSLFLIQFLLGAAVAFFSTACLTLFLSTYEVTMLPVAYMLAGACLLLFNYGYARMESKYAPDRLLQLAMLFAAFSVLVCWVALAFFPFKWLALFLVVWNLVIYLLIGVAFWGMVAVLFDVREGKRLFSIVGAGDIPAKMLGYLSVSVLVPFIGVDNLLWVSVASFTAAYLLFSRYNNKGIIATEDAVPPHVAASRQKPDKSVVAHFFKNNLILSIAIWFLISYTILLLIDYTFISEIKLEKTNSQQLATFIAVFFALGRLLAMVFKLVFSSRVMARLGLANSLLIVPALLFLLNGAVLVSGEGVLTYLYLFGVMALLAEVLRSTLQEPVVLVLFQPLDPRSRLKGHVIAKGYTLPFALFGVGAFLAIYLQQYGGISVAAVSRLLLFLLIVWAGSVLLIRKTYLQTLIDVLQKGLFTGTALFLNSQPVRDFLVFKTASAKPQEVIHSLDLLEKSGYQGMDGLFLRLLRVGSLEVKEYVLSRVIDNNLNAALPLIKEQVADLPEARLKPLLLKAQFLLEESHGSAPAASLEQLDPVCRKAALIGLLQRKGDVNQAAVEALSRMVEGEVEDKLMALDTIAELSDTGYEHLVDTLLHDSDAAVYSRAIEVVGQVKYYQLFAAAAGVAESKQAYGPLQKALLAFGDPVYKDEYVLRGVFPDSLTLVLLRTAGRTKGENSTVFLENALKRYPDKTDSIVKALWEKKAVPGPETREALGQWLDNRLNQSLQKIGYYMSLRQDKETHLLQEALCSEIHQGIQSILQGLSLVYSQERIERVMELYRLGPQHQLSNAIEMLELLIPKRYFLSLDGLLEFMQDVKSNQLYGASPKAMTAGAIIHEILSDNRAGCNSWTRSVACYLIPRVPDKGLLLPALANTPDNGDYLFRETRNHVVSMLS